MNAALQIFAIMMAVMGPVIVLVFIVEYFKYKKSTNQQLRKLEKELENNSTDEIGKELTLLKERVIVLERIVTDQNYELERKIRSL